MKNYDKAKFAETQRMLAEAEELSVCAFRELKESLCDAEPDDLEAELTVTCGKEIMALEKSIKKIRKMLCALEA